MKFLHLTDLHVGKPNGAQSAALNTLLDDIRSSITHSIDAILLTGDLVYSGDTKEYERFNTLIIQPLKEFSHTKDSTLIATPGNHDLNATITLPMCAWDELGPKRQDIFFDNSEEGRQVREPRTKGFAAYSQFIKKTNIQGLDPLSAVCERITLKDTEIYTINTSLFSDPIAKDQLKSQAPTSALREAARNRDPHKRLIVIGHHPIDWFSRQTQTPFKSLLQQLNATYIHGHMHEVSSQWVSTGLLSLGIGAAYQASLGRVDPFYRNGYAYGEFIETSVHITIRQWDATNGIWHIGPLPSDFRTRSPTYPDGHILQLQQSKTQAPAAPKANRVAPKITEVLCTTTLQDGDWQTILTSAGIIGRGTTLRPLANKVPGRCDFSYPEANGHARVHCISSPGHVLSSLELEGQNTQFDTEDFTSLLLISLGTVSDEAKQLSTRLSRKKAIRTFGNSDIAAELNSTLKNKINTDSQPFDAADVTATAVLDNGQWLSLIIDRLNQGWFALLSGAGELIEETSPSVSRVRAIRPDLSHSAYNNASPSLPPLPHTPFDRNAYLAKCKIDFDSLQYGGLATIGLRLPTSKLSDVYIAPTVDVTQRGDATEAYHQAISELLDSLKLDDAQRAPLELQLRNTNSAYTPRETRGASIVYQQHGSVAVLGDPGSGKTSFVKTEILAYCKTCQTSQSWYSTHTPIYIPLAEAAALLTQEKDLLSIAATLAMRRTLPITKTHIEQLTKGGHAAFFFDGLDEIATVDARASITEEIREFISQWSISGNRFVLTSRPAAVNMIQLPEEMTVLRLRGLTEVEIKSFIRKILSAEITSDTLGIKLSALDGDTEKKELIERILRDCTENNGIKRLASNPLLLTLLVMIYANSGPLAAKKHRVYGQAVQTLVTVRNRVPGGAVFSEADLRRRLGHVALNLFLAQRVDIPSRSDFEQLLMESLKSEKRKGDLATEAKTFVQSVAESTGLLVLHKNGGDSGNESVSFMHHSFFEYYVAQGLIAQGKSELIRAHILEPRWREVAEIAAGLIGDVSDVTPLIQKLLQPQDASEVISGEHLLFAIDCALECDVPPLATQDAIADSVLRTVTEGPALFDSDFRSSLGDRLSRLLDASGSASIRQILFAGISSEKSEVCTAFIDLFGAIGASADLEENLIDHFSKTAARTEAPIKTAIIGALVTAPSLRTPATLKALQEGFRGPTALRLSAVKAAERDPRLAKEVWDELLSSLDATNPAIASAAARALLEGGLDVAGEQNRALVDKCLRLWAITRREAIERNLSISVSREHISNLLSSAALNEKALGVRLLPWLERDEVFVVTELMASIRQDRFSELRRAALLALRQAERACAALTIADVDELSRLLTAPERDIRISAAKVLSLIQSDDATKTLLKYMERTKKDEFQEALRALVKNRGRSDEVRNYIIRETLARVGEPGAGAFGNKEKQNEIKTLLRCCAQLTGDVSGALPSRLQRIANSFKAPASIRRLSAKAFARTVPINPWSLNILIKWTRTGGPLGDALGDSVLAYLRKSRAKVEHVRNLIPLMPELIKELTHAWGRAYSSSNSEQQSNIKSIRKALREAQEMDSAYSEFARIRRAS